jgi:hypothetical protein
MKKYFGSFLLFCWFICLSLCWVSQFILWQAGISNTRQLVLFLLTMISSFCFYFVVWGKK